MTNLEILKAARKLIEKPENWTQGEMAKTVDGYATGYSSEKACKFCIAGAMSRVDPFWFISLRHRLYKHVVARGYGTVEGFNDYPDRTHAEVLAFFDEAIAAEEDR